MPISVFGSSKDNISSNKIDTSSFVQKPYLRSNYIESDNWRRYRREKYI